MKRYDYYKAVTSDIIDYIKADVDFSEFLNVDELRDYLYDFCWTADSITGNASGSYTFSARKAEENISHNLDLLAEALAEYGETATEALTRGAEYCDVTIRCYVLGDCIEQALDELETDGYFDCFDEDEDEDEEA